MGEKTIEGMLEELKEGLRSGRISEEALRDLIDNPRPPIDAGSIRVSVVFDAETKKMVDDLRAVYLDSYGSVTVAQVLRDAIGLFDWAAKVIGDGDHIGRTVDGKKAKGMVSLPFKRFQ